MSNDMKFEVIRSHRKSIAIEIRPNGSIYVRAPYTMKEIEILAFVKKKENWIRIHLEKVKVRQNISKKVERLSREEISDLADTALKVIPLKVSYYARLMQVTYGRITIRSQKTRWGSCSGKGNLNFNCLLMLVPDEVVDYVVVHELCHLVEMNHSQAFWSQVEKVMPEYRKHRAWLKEHGHEIMARIHEDW